MTAQEGSPLRVIVEMAALKGSAASELQEIAESIPAFQSDPDFAPVPVLSTPDSARAMSLEEAGEETVIVRGTVSSDQMDALARRPGVEAVWEDTPIAAFEEIGEDTVFVEVSESAVTTPCPIPPCDCDPGTPKGTLDDVAKYLGADRIWEMGHRGERVVVGVVDGGLTTPSRVTGGKIPRVIGGLKADWGKTALWGGHGEMCATDVLGIAPEAELYDLRIPDSSDQGSAAWISDAIAGFQWAINRHKADGTPQILTNGWGIYQKAWDPVYATNPNHPFTRKVVDAANEGIIVLFAAGNCGGTCPSGRCGSDKGPAKSIWGANGHPAVMTVGAANAKEQLIGYSSQGPAALDQHKPDFCSISHFKGYFDSDTGTSAACSVAAGVVALLKSVDRGLGPARAKSLLKATAKTIGPAGWDQHSGSGIIQAAPGLPEVTERVKAASRALSDKDTTRDRLGFSAYAEAIKDLIASQGTATPLTIAIDAPWGFGKTSLMRMIQERVAPKKTPLYKGAHPTVFFNAWQYEGESALWAALVLEVLGQVGRQLSLAQRIKLQTRLAWRRLDRTRLLRSVIDSLTKLTLLVLLGGLAFAAAHRLLGSQQALGWTAIGGGVISVLLGFYRFGRRVHSDLLAPLDLKLSSYIQAPDYRQKVGFLADFRDDFEALVEIVTDGRRWGRWPLVIFIDDLDRCAPPKIAGIIEAINVTLSCDHCVFVLGLDVETVAASIEARYQHMRELLVDADCQDRLAVGRQFLEKIIQIHFRIPRANRRVFEQFIESCFGEAEQRVEEKDPAVARAESLIKAVQRKGSSRKDAVERVRSRSENDVQVDRAAESVARKDFDDSEDFRRVINEAGSNLESSPRRLKRFINVLRLRALICEQRGLLESGVIDLPLLGWLLLVDTRWPRLAEAMRSDVGIVGRLLEVFDKRSVIAREAPDEGVPEMAEAYEVRLALAELLADPIVEELAYSNDLERLLPELRSLTQERLKAHDRLARVAA